MSDVGFGLSGFGNSIFGFGTPGSTNSSTAKIFIKSNGTRGNAAKIDPQTGDFILDDAGNVVGDDSINQMVYMALRTTKNTSVLLNFGIDISKIRTITDNVKMKFQLAVNDAVKHLTDKRLITILSVDVISILNMPTSLQVVVTFKNLTNNEINSFKLVG